MSVESLTKIVLAVISIATVLISTFVVPYIKNNIGIDKYNHIVDICTLAVRSAEQLYSEYQRQTKKDYVRDFMRNVIKNTSGLDMTDEELDVLIEGVVNEVKKSNKKDGVADGK